MTQPGLVLLIILLNGIACQKCNITWFPSDDMGDHEINPGFLLGTIAGFGFYLFSNTLNDSNVAERVKLDYYSRDNPKSPISFKIDHQDESVMRKIKKPLKIIIHGYLHSPQNTMLTDLRKQLLEFQDVNVIVVDWRSISRHPWYWQVVERAEIVGRYVARLLDSLVFGGARPEDIHLMAHSLGAHVSGFAANHFKGGKIGRITGMDPALPAFKNAQPSQRLDPSDADFVDCIHTCGGSLGFMAPICHADFYPNGGRKSQPGCLVTDVLGLCSHRRASKFFQESIDPAHKFSVAKCPDIPKKDPVVCTFSDVNMGYYVNSSVRGIFYGVTSFESPYSVLFSS